MRYVDGYVLTVSKKNLKKYEKMAKDAGKIWIKHGALSYMECVGDDMKPEWCSVPFPKLTNAKPGHVPVFSFIVYKSKAQRDRVNAKVMKEMEKKYTDHDASNMPFDMNTMAYGGFTALVDLP